MRRLCLNHNANSAEKIVQFGSSFNNGISDFIDRYDLGMQILLHREHIAEGLLYRIVDNFIEDRLRNDGVFILESRRQDILNERFIDLACRNNKFGRILLVLLSRQAC